MPRVCPNPVPRKCNGARGYESLSCGQNAVFGIVWFGTYMNGDEENLGCFGARSCYVYLGKTDRQIYLASAYCRPP